MDKENFIIQIGQILLRWKDYFNNIFNLVMTFKRHSK